MASRDELLNRFAAVRAEAKAGATVATFDRYAELVRAARASGAADIAAGCLKDLATLAAQLDPAVGKELARAAAAQGAAVAAEPSPPAGPIDLSVLVVGAPVDPAHSRAARSLETQTLSPSRFETLLVDRTDGAALEDAVAATRGRVLLFVDAGLELASDALARHLAWHADASEPVALLGGVELPGLEARPLAWLVERLGLGAVQSGATECARISGELITTTHWSVPAAALRAAGGFDRELHLFHGAELGTRLERQGVACVVDPAIGGRLEALDGLADLASLCRRWRTLGFDRWRLLARHGAGAPPSWMKEVGLDPAARDALLERLLGGGDTQARCIASLSASLAEIEQVIARAPQRREEILGKVAEDATQLLLNVMRFELMRGFVAAAHGGRQDALERCATGLGRGAAVLVVNDRAGLAAVTAVLDHLPEGAELVVASAVAALRAELPRDDRLIATPLPPAADLRTLRRLLLEASQAGFFVLLDGTEVPLRTEWQALELALSAAPCIGACGLDDTDTDTGGGAFARAALREELPTALLAVRRDVIESDTSEAGPFLERLKRRGFKLARTTAAQAPLPSCSG